MPPAASSAYRNSRVGVPSPHKTISPRSPFFASAHLADQGGDDVRGVQVEVVARAVQVDRQQEDAVEAVLLAVGLRLHQHHLLRQPVGRVRFLRVALPQVVLPERDRGELGVGADRPDGDEFLDPGHARPLDELEAHDGAVVEEPAGVVLVGRDAADHGGEVDDDVGPRVGEEPADRVPVAQVVVRRARHGDLPAAARPQLVHHERPQKPRPAGDDGARLGSNDVLAHCLCTHRLTALLSRVPPFRPAISSSTISRTSSWKVVRGSQPSFLFALAASPISRSTSAGRS